MTTFGKVLAFLNILGAIGLGCLTVMDYARRQAWAYSLLRHDLVIDGLPLDESQKDPRGRAIADLIGENTQRDLFSSVGNNPVVTQLAEVKRVRGLLDGKAQAAADKRKQIPFYARVLLNLAGSNLQREHLLACRTWFADDKTVAQLKDRLQDAFQKAVRGPAPDDGAPAGPAKPFEFYFRQAVREKGGEPMEPFATLVVELVPDDLEKAKAVNFDAVFEGALDAQLARLQKRYQEAFDEAASGKEVVQGAPKETLAGDPRRLRVARFLFALCPVLAEEALSSAAANPSDLKLLSGLPADSLAYGQQLTQTEAYKTASRRVLVVVGLKAGIDAVTEQAEIVQRISGELTKELIADQMAFVATHAQVLERVREAAAQVEAEAGLLDRQQKAVAEQQALVKQRKRDVDSYETELAESRAKTEVEMQKLADMSARLFKFRTILRDTEVANVRGYQKIVELEKQIRDLEGTRSASKRP